MDFTSIENVQEQIPVLIGNLNDRGNLLAFDVVQQLKLTLPAAIKYNMAEDVANIKKGIIVFLSKETNSGSYNPFFPICRLIDESRRAFTKEDKEEIYPLVYLRFSNEIKALKDNQEYSLHGILEMGKELSKYHAKQQNYIKVDSILNSMIDSIEASDSAMPAMRKVSLYRDLIPLIRDLGRKDALERVNKILQDNAPHIKNEMGQTSFNFSVPNDLIDKEYKSMTDGFSVDEALSVFSLRFVPDNSFINEYARKYLNETDSLNMFRHMYFRTDGNLSHEVGPDFCDSNARYDQACSTVLQYLGVLLHLIILKGQEVGLFSVDNIMDFVSRVPYLSEKRIRIIEKGVAAYLDHDYITSISILVPQTEHLIRVFFLSNGYTVTDNDKTGTTSDALGTLLDNDDIIVFEKNISNYLRLILSMKTGWNVRNLYCHGLEESFSLSHADRVFHIVILMATLLQPNEE
ncbi:MAG: DUF4209 domain-containing protein [Bacteroidales bacterium]|nr:DUF4209 domain-containing protein [Bacteroidales bacterium]